MCIIYICPCLKVYRPSICIFFEVEDNESLQIWSGKKRSNEPGPNMIVRKMSLIGITTVRVTAPKLGSHFAKEELHPPRTSIFHHFSVAVYQLLPLGVFFAAVSRWWNGSGTPPMIPEIHIVYDPSISQCQFLRCKSSIFFGTPKYWLVVLIILKNISQWEGLSHILWKIKTVPKHQPEYHMIESKFCVCLDTTNTSCFSMVHGCNDENPLVDHPHANYPTRGYWLYHIIWC